MGTPTGRRAGTSLRVSLVLGGSDGFLSAVADRVAPQVDRYYDSPAAFVTDCFSWKSGEGPTGYQLEILERVPTERRVAVRGPRGLGKTCLSAWVVLWFALTRDLAGVDWKAPTTAGGWRQLTKFTWPEIHKWAQRIDWAKLGRGKFNPKSELMVQSLRLQHGEAFAAASDNPWLIEGAHADSLLFVFDEAKAIPDKTWDSAEGTFSGAGENGLEAFVLAISTPGEPVGRYYQIHQRAKGFDHWWPKHVTLDETIAAGRVTQEWASRQALAWGVDSALYQNHVVGEFWSADEDGVIPLGWVDAAMSRWEKAHPDCEPGSPHPDFVPARHVCELPEFTSVGVDPARYGPDLTALALRHGGEISEIRTFAKKDTIEVASLTQRVLLTYGGKAVVDVGGLGAGVVDQLRADKHSEKRTIAFNGSESTPYKDRTGEIGFANKRAAAWWHLRELLDPHIDDPISLPPWDQLRGELTTPKYREVAGGKIIIESKDDIRKRLGGSPDLADAIAYAFWIDMGHKTVICAPFAQHEKSYWKAAG